MTNDPFSPPDNISIPAYAAPSERDMDFLLVEELSCSATFAQWFLESAGLHAKAMITKVSRSVATWDGETDVEVLCSVTDGVTALLVENKISAAYQPLQAQRYIRRGELGIEQGQWSRFITVLVAPQAYLSDTADAALFHKTITYEDLKLRVGNGAGEARAAFKRSLIAQAITKAKVPWTPHPNLAITQFFRSFRAHAIRSFPDIIMPPEEGTRSPTSKWILIRAPGLPRSRALIEVKPHTGHVDLRLYGVPEADVVSMLGERVGWQLETTPAGRSCSIRLRVTPMDLTKVFEGQEAVADECLRAVRKLLELIASEKVLFERLLDLHPFPLAESL